jgi:hypothetical protein
VEAELRELGRELDVPPAASLTAGVRQRLEGPAVPRRRVVPWGKGAADRWRPAWRAALVVLAVLAVLLVATPQGRAVVTHVLRFVGIELQQEPGPAPSPRSSGGRVASLIYRRTPYGLVRMDEFAGHLDPVFFQKFVYLGNVTQVRVNGRKGLWIRGPHELLYITRDGTPAAASARLTTGNTLIWGTRRVALRLEGNLTRAAALTIASSAR